MNHRPPFNFRQSKIYQVNGLKYIEGYDTCISGTLTCMDIHNGGPYLAYKLNTSWWACSYMLTLFIAVFM